MPSKRFLSTQNGLYNALQSEVRNTNTISFDKDAVYGSFDSPLTGALVFSSANYRPDTVARIYHNDANPLSYEFPSEFKVEYSSEPFVGKTNIIYAHAHEGNFVLITITSLNNAPTATSLSITGTTNVGDTLNFSYTYTDADGDLEGDTVLQVYRQDDVGGTNRVAISGANGTSYTLTNADQNKYIVWGVRPVAQSGRRVGNETFSSPSAQVTGTALGPELIPAANQLGTDANTNGVTDGYFVDTVANTPTVHNDNANGFTAPYQRMVNVSGGGNTSMLSTVVFNTNTNKRLRISFKYRMSNAAATLSFNLVNGFTTFWGTAVPDNTGNAVLFTVDTPDPISVDLKAQFIMTGASPSDLYEVSELSIKAIN